MTQCSANFPRRTYPCNECPIRCDNADNPSSQFSAQKWEELSVTVRHGLHQPGLHDILFGCHKGEPGTNADLACAGWLVQFGHDHMRIRMAVATGSLPHEALVAGDNWPELHDTWDEVVANHTLEE